MITNAFKNRILPNASKLINVFTFILLLCFSLNAGADAHEEITTVSAEVAYILNTFLFLVCGFLVMFMAAGFCMLEAGMVRSKNTAVICLKNIGLFSIAGIMYYLVGYNLMYDGVDGGFIGSFSLFDRNSEVDLETGYASASDWYFQMVFVATAASIVSGALAERILIWPFFLFVAILTGLIYPIAGSWQWGGGWLSEMGFSDFAGSTLVHSVGGWAALAGAILLGARDGKYSAQGDVNIIPGCSLPMTTLGVFVLWLGWFGFNGGSQLAMGTADDAIAVSTIFINTFLAGAGGVLGAAVITRLHFGKTDVIQMLNGCIGGLVSVTAEPLMPSPLAAILIGAVGGLIVVYGTKLLFSLKIDDVVGAIPAHLFAGIWGTLIVPATNSGANFSSQLIGVLSVNVFVFIVAYIAFSIIKATIGLRLSKEGETKGTDVTETGVIAYAIRD